MLLPNAKYIPLLSVAVINENGITHPELVDSLDVKLAVKIYNTLLTNPNYNYHRQFYNTVIDLLKAGF